MLMPLAHACKLAENQLTNLHHLQSEGELSDLAGDEPLFKALYKWWVRLRYNGSGSTHALPSRMVAWVKNAVQMVGCPGRPYSGAQAQGLHCTGERMVVLCCRPEQPAPPPRKPNQAYSKQLRDGGSSIHSTGCPAHPLTDGDPSLPLPHSGSLTRAACTSWCLAPRRSSCSLTRWWCATS